MNERETQKEKNRRKINDSYKSFDKKYLKKFN